MLNKANLIAILNITLGIILAAYPAIRIRIFSALLGVGLGIEVDVLLVRRPKIQRRYLIAVLACLALAYIIWTLNDRLIQINPSSLLQGIAWRLLTAVSTTFTFRYYLSDESGAA